ncbi:hypothetical protein DV738_g2376, partial [Chaetothyriales sp. CBS 135597]
MAEPLSIASGVAGLLSLGLQSTEYLYNYYTAYRDQDKHLAHITDQLGGLLDSLQRIDEAVHSRTRRPNEQSIIASIERAISSSDDIIQLLQDEVGKFKKEPTDSWKRKALVIGRKAAYPFRRSTFGDLEDNISDFRQNLSHALDALQLKEHQNTQDDIQDVSTIVKNIQAQTVSANLRQWLRAPDATVNLNDASSKRHAGTGQWLVRGQAYAAWLQQDNSFLWLYGFAGCGKSVICSTAIQHVFRQRQSSSDSAVAFFFFTFNDESKQDASAALRALLLQLCGQVPDLEADLDRLRRSYNQGTPPVPVLLEHLRQAITRCRNIYLLLDALDESPADSSRAEVLSMIKTMRQWQMPGLHLLVTSRDVPDIRARLQLPAPSQGAEHIMLNNDSIQQDISRFISSQLDNDPQLQRWGDQREKIKDYLTQHSGGVFRWVECQLRALQSGPHNEKRLQKCLRTLPRTLDETYERMLCGIESSEKAQQLLLLLCYSMRPLSVEEAIEALAVDIDDLECYDPESRCVGGADDLLDICPGLIEISPTKNPSGYYRTPEDEMVGAQTVRIAHFSVKEYLLSPIERWIRLYEPHEYRLEEVNYEETVEDQASATYYASLLGLDGVLRHILSISVVDVNAQGGWFCTPLYAASFCGNEKVVQILLDNGADVNAQGGHFGYALQAAAVEGHEQIVEILLDRGADINAQGGDYDNALYATSVEGHEEIVQLLLDRGADINAQGANALHTALLNGCKQIVELLLDKGADINAWGGEYGNALQAALAEDHEKIAQLLLSRGADINAQGGDHGNALQIASVKGYKQIVELLLDRGADINAQGDDELGTPLYAASAMGHEEIVQLLLDRGADINAKGGEYSNALQAASAQGNEKVVQLLLDRGADINAKGGEYSNALQAASAQGNEKVVQLLLDRGADINAQGGEYGNALQIASVKGYKQIVELLLDRGADINAQGDDELGTPLYTASAMGHEEIVQLLLDRGADINAQGGEYSNALQAASDGGHEKIVQLLLNRGADINAQGDD